MTWHIVLTYRVIFTRIIQFVQSTHIDHCDEFYEQNKTVKLIRSTEKKIGIKTLWTDFVATVALMLANSNEKYGSIF